MRYLMILFLTVAGIGSGQAACPATNFTATSSYALAIGSNSAAAQALFGVALGGTCTTQMLGQLGNPSTTGAPTMCTSTQVMSYHSFAASWSTSSDRTGAGSLAGCQLRRRVLLRAGNRRDADRTDGVLGRALVQAYFSLSIAQTSISSGNVR